VTCQEVWGQTCVEGEAIELKEENMRNKGIEKDENEETMKSIFLLYFSYYGNLL
jgi:uncharacterized protein Veg